MVDSVSAVDVFVVAVNETVAAAVVVVTVVVVVVAVATSVAPTVVVVAAATSVAPTVVVVVAVPADVATVAVTIAAAVPVNSAHFGPEFLLQFDHQQVSVVFLTAVLVELATVASFVATQETAFDRDDSGAVFAIGHTAAATVVVVPDTASAAQ